jgi:hypothetical protein
VQSVRRFALAALIVFAGCGDSGHPTVSARVVSTAAAKTTQASTARISEKISATGNGDSLGDGSTSGVVDSRHRNASIAFDLSPLAKATGDDPNVVKGRVVYLGANAFVTSPAITSRLPTGRRWIELTKRQAETTGGPTGGVSGTGTLDLTKPVDHLRAAVGDTERLGAETVNGVPTTHYRTHIDYRLYIPLVPRDQRATFTKAVEKLDSTLGSTRFPAEVWIAADGTIRRHKGLIEGRGLKIEYTLDLTAVGKPVHIVQPPAIRVLDGRKPP